MLLRVCFLVFVNHFSGQIGTPQSTPSTIVTQLCAVILLSHSGIGSGLTQTQRGENATEQDLVARVVLEILLL